MGKYSMKFKNRLNGRVKSCKGGSMVGRFAVPAGLLVLQKMMHRRTKKSKPYRKSMRKGSRKASRKASRKRK